jgi:hypothetical protein
MIDARQQLLDAESRRYVAECRRLAALARPRTKPVVSEAKRGRQSEWLDTIVRQLAGKRQRGLATSHR